MLADVLSPQTFAAAVRMATPIALAAMGGTICERAGVVNIALEGMMLAAAFGGTATVLLTGSYLAGVVMSMLVGAAFALAHAFASVTLKADQIVSGTALNLLALGLTGFLMEVIFGYPGATETTRAIQPLFDFQGPTEGVLGTAWSWIDTVLLSYTPIAYVAILLAVIGQWAIYRTRWGLRLRALGEHPRAADTVGVNVARGRYIAVLASGALAGLAGANLTLEQVGGFSEGMTNGRGFIALAANIFGRWTPAGSYLASLLFGFTEAIEIRLQVFRDVIRIPPQFFLMLPYLLTIIVLAGAMGRAIAPASVGKPYIKE